MLEIVLTPRIGPPPKSGALSSSLFNLMANSRLIGPSGNSLKSEEKCDFFKFRIC